MHRFTWAAKGAGDDRIVTQGRVCRCSGLLTRVCDGTAGCGPGQGLPPGYRKLCDTQFVDPRNRAWLLIVTLSVLVGGSIGAAAWYRARHISAGMLIKRLPVEDSVILYIDFAE